MTQNHVAVCIPEPVTRRVTPRTHLRDAAETTLKEMAYVLHLTRKVKQAILDESRAGSAK